MQRRRFSYTRHFSVQVYTAVLYPRIRLQYAIHNCLRLSIRLNIEIKYYYSQDYSQIQIICLAEYQLCDINRLMSTINIIHEHYLAKIS